MAAMSNGATSIQARSGLVRADGADTAYGMTAVGGGGTGRSVGAGSAETGAALTCRGIGPN